MAGSETQGPLAPDGLSQPGQNGTPVSTTVLLADAQTRTRTAMKIALEHHGFVVVAEADSADEAVAAAFEHRPQVCLLDVGMPGDAIHAIGRISARLPGTKIAILTTATSEGALIDAITAGADGYLLKGTAPDRLTVALNALLLGEATLPRALTGSLVRELRGRGPSTHADDNQAPDPVPETATASSLNGDDPTAPRLVAISLPADDLGRRSVALYVPRLMRHFLRRVRAGWGIRVAWASARERMHDYH
jgi:DNA-binding NarL/FixJ family response regulator